MRVSGKGIAALIAHEGIVPGPYLDSVGVWTYGVGHTKAAGHPNPAAMPRGVPDDLDKALADVFNVFAADLEKYAEDVMRAVKVPMAQHEFDAAVSFHYNTGAIARASWVKHWNAGDKPAASRGIMNWSKPAEIIPRRRSERDLFSRGIYPSGKATVWGVTAAGKVIWKPLRTLSQAYIMALMKPATQTQPAFVDHTPPKATQSPLAALFAAIAALFGRKS